MFTSGYANTGKKFSIAFIKQLSQEKKQTLLFRALIKREILTSRKVLYTKLVRAISLRFAKKMLSKTRVFLT